MINRVLVANRGEIARRVARTCAALGIETVAVFSDADEDALFVREATRAVRLPGTSSADTYLRIDLVVAAALKSGADAVHPGYGFLAENPAFAEAVIDAGLTWIGPPPSAMRSMGSKIEAKRLMRSAGVPVLPEGDEAGFPALVKASAGGGGRGMRIVRSEAELAGAVEAAAREAESAFGDGTVFVERYVERGRHIEIQMFADQHGNCVSLFERECSIQRRHQKIVEESPSPAVNEVLRAEMGAAAVAAARSVGYVGAGTVEFLLAPDGRFYFLEMNTRLQVEHPVTELVTGLDLVALQIAVAEGSPLPPAALHPTVNGHAIEVRLCAEDPAAGYLPQSGRVVDFDIPALANVRVDTGVMSGDDIPPYYDSMFAKVIAWAPTRSGAARLLAFALSSSRVHGVATNRDQLVQVLRHPEFLAGDIDTGFLERNPCTERVDGTHRLAAVAAALVGQARSREQVAVLPLVPSGWRNVTSQDQTVEFDIVGIGLVSVGYRFDRNGAVARLTVDGEPLGVTAGTPLTGSVLLTENGVSTRFHVRIGDQHAYVDSLEGSWTLRLVDRFPLPDSAGLAGSLVAPMPGSILRVLVETGQQVIPGQPLVVLEAMKMEHQVVAPSGGTVTQVLVAPGNQVSTGQALLVLEDKS
ncbi:MAG: ATP-grasp domain-containing protein [Actinobacteria bacterium]|uniref:Unannotated protein n=1 Tax=freshwater metagenome TaxID=449393 RepID=A0A6J6UMV9_9ZZZZ|nr:ATP-grasp domain-containing protein [Actinomycetota bacterium]